MRPDECPREADVLDALQTSAWPDCCPADLRAHVESCASCADLVAVVLPLIDEHRAASLQAHVPSSGIVWWRAQMRARREAEAAAMRPISIVQWLALACAVGLLAGAATLMSPAFRQWIGGAADAIAALGGPEGPAVEWSAAAALTSPIGIAALLAFAMVALVTPVALYLARGED